MENWQVRIFQNPMMTMTDIFIFRRIGDGKVEVLQRDLQTIKTLKSSEQRSNDYTLSLPDFIFQSLVDAVHQYKPSEGKYTEGKLEATENHLTDLRHLLKLPIKN